MLRAPVLTFRSDVAALPTASFLPQPPRVASSSSSVHAKQLSRGPPGSHGAPGERQRVASALASSGPKASVQVTVAGGQVGQVAGSLSSVTIQAQQYLEGMWSISRVNSFLPQPKPV